MNALLRISIMAVVAAVIGWITNLLAIRMIFRPLHPVRIPVVGWELQGIIPKRRDEIAVNIGKMVEQELISMDDIVDMVVQGENKDKLLYNIKQNVNRIIDEKLPSLVPNFIRENIFKYTSKSIDEEADKFIDSVVYDIMHQSGSTISIAKMVEDKINSFELLTLEEMIISLSKTELKHIEVLGGILGLIIGIIQGILMMFLPI